MNRADLIWLKSFARLHGPRRHLFLPEAKRGCQFFHDRVFTGDEIQNHDRVRGPVLICCCFPAGRRRGVLRDKRERNDLVRMKLSSYRDKDRVHIRGMDAAGLITNDVEHGLSEELPIRLRNVRETE